ncbi:MAG: xanthine dehydrogenase family protein molybdopterin-binding subunit [Chloroflexota bacterium]
MPLADPPEFTVIGHEVKRHDGPAKVAGTARYVPNISMQGMLHAAYVHGDRPHARLLRVDAEHARQAEGVVAVVTGPELAGWHDVEPWLGPAFKDQPVLAIDRVRYFGEPLAVVVAETRDTARAAAELVEVEYEDLPAVYDVREAVKPSAPLVHDEFKPAKVFADLAHLAGKANTNVCYHYHLETGDVDKAFAEAAQTFEDECSVPFTQHAPLETHAALAWVEGDVLEMWAATQTPSFVRQEIAEMLRLPLNRVRVRVPYLGGGYGAKMYDKIEPIVALLAWKLRQPIKMVLTREEEFLITTRHGSYSRIRSAVDASGNLTAVAVEMYYDTGAYADIGPRIASKSGMTAIGPYKLPNVRLDSYCVYTNKPSAGPLRGFGVPQAVLTHEIHVERVARALGQDPVEYRLRHLLQAGEEHPTGSSMVAAGFKECLEAAAKELPHPPLSPSAQDRERVGNGRFKRGIGYASAAKAVLTPSTSTAILQKSSDGSTTILTSTVEMGQGSDMTLAQIAAETLGINPRDVRIVQPDTDITPYDTITAGSRSTYHMGNAVNLAAGEVRQQLLAVAAEHLEVAVEDLELRYGRVSVRGTDRGMTISEIFLARFGSWGTSMVGQGVFQTSTGKIDRSTGHSDKITEHWFPGAAAAQVLVDTWTGRVTVERLVVVADVGRAISRSRCEQQLLGAALHGLGTALFEELVIEDGRPLNATMLEYQLPSMLDVPIEFVPVIVEVPHPSGPYGAVGIGETGILAIAPALSNAILDATGVKFTHLPITPEKILAGLP